MSWCLHLHGSWSDSWGTLYILTLDQFFHGRDSRSAPWICWKRKLGMIDFSCRASSCGLKTLLRYLVQGGHAKLEAPFLPCSCVKLLLDTWLSHRVKNELPEYCVGLGIKGIRLMVLWYHRNFTALWEPIYWGTSSLTKSTFIITKQFQWMTEGFEHCSGGAWGRGVFPNPNRSFEAKCLFGLTSFCFFLCSQHVQPDWVPDVRGHLW